MSEFVKKIQFSDGTVRYVYDTGAARKEDLDNYLPLTGGIIDGNIEVTGDAIFNSLAIQDISWVEVGADIDNVLVHDNDGGISKRSTDDLLEDIGGISYNIDDQNGILKFKIGKND